MNTKIKLFFILCTCMCIGIVSCNDDEKEKTDYAKEIVGNYKGVITIKGTDAPVANNVEVNVVYDSENKVILKMNQEVIVFQINIECESDVKYSNNEYNVSGNTTLDFVAAAGMPAVPLPVSVSGKIDSKKVATLNIAVALPSDLPMQIEGLPIDVVFTGTKQ